MRVRLRPVRRAGRSLGGTDDVWNGIVALFEGQPDRYAFVSCKSGGYTEVYDLRTLEGRDDLGRFLEVLFAD